MKIDVELINKFLWFYKNQWTKERTLDWYRYDFMAFYRYLKENKKDTVEQIDKLTIEDYKQVLFSFWGSKYSRYKDIDNLTSATIYKKLIVIKKFLGFTTYVYDIWLDPSKVRLNKLRNRKGDYLEVDEVKKVFEAIDKVEKFRLNRLRDKLLIILCFVSWARCEEMRQITIDWVREGKQKIVWKWSKERWIFFNQQCKDLLEEYLVELWKPLPNCWKIGIRKNNKRLAVISHFYKYFGNPICKQTIYLLFKKLNKYCKFEGKHITLHSLRHSFATKMANEGTNPFQLKEMMWHQNINTTAWYYHGNVSMMRSQQWKVFSWIYI